MLGLLAVLATLVGLASIPLALAGGTAWMILPAHLFLTALCGIGTVMAGLGGRPSAARAFGLGHVLVSLCIAIALAMGSEAHDGSWYWWVPWGVPMLWVWVPGALSSVFAEVGTHRRQARNGRVVRRRRRALLAQASTAPGKSEG